MQNRLIQFITQELLHGYGTIELNAEDNLLTSGLLDSLGVMQLVNFIEEEFHISVSPEDVTIENFQSVEVIAGYVGQKQTKQPV